MGIVVYSLVWVMQDFDHQPYDGYGSSLKDTAHFTELSLHPSAKVPRSSFSIAWLT